MSEQPKYKSFFCITEDNLGNHLLWTKFLMYTIILFFLCLLMYILLLVIWLDVSPYFFCMSLLIKNRHTQLCLRKMKVTCKIVLHLSMHFPWIILICWLCSSSNSTTPASPVTRIIRSTSILLPFSKLVFQCYFHYSLCCDIPFVLWLVI